MGWSVNSKPNYFQGLPYVNSGPISPVGSKFQLAFGHLQIRFPAPAYSFTSCQLLVKA